MPLHVRMLGGVAVGVVAGLVAHRLAAGDPQASAWLAWFQAATLPILR